MSSRVALARGHGTHARPPPPPPRPRPRHAPRSPAWRRPRPSTPRTARRAAQRNGAADAAAAARGARAHGARARRCKLTRLTGHKTKAQPLIIKKNVCDDVRQPTYARKSLKIKRKVKTKALSRESGRDEILFCALWLTSTDDARHNLKKAKRGKERFF